jgi:hypothetical protein
MTYLI